MSSGPEGERIPSRPSRIYDRICSDSCVIQVPLDVAGGSIYDNVPGGPRGKGWLRRAVGAMAGQDSKMLCGCDAIMLSIMLGDNRCKHKQP